MSLEVALFVIVMCLNVYALVRHYMMMRMMLVMLKGFAETQEQFNEILAQEQQQRRLKDARQD